MRTLCILKFQAFWRLNVQVVSVTSMQEAAGEDAMQEHVGSCAHLFNMLCPNFF